MDQRKDPPPCTYCAAHGNVEEAVMSYDIPTPLGDQEIALCARHFYELRDALNKVYDDAHGRKKRAPLLLPPGISMN